MQVMHTIIFAHENERNKLSRPEVREQVEGKAKRKQRSSQLKVSVILEGLQAVIPTNIFDKHCQSLAVSAQIAVEYDSRVQYERL